ncbi:MAG: hypothetical protein LBD97_01505 [Bifidobacteriaceae bacterium]|jgi:hypothetical protein|nr:hypothetical protein [Bifidobacteriaceae bacterium]
MSALRLRPAAATNVKRSTTATPHTKAYTSVMRHASAGAERHITAGVEDPWPDSPGSEFDDAPSPDDLPDWDFDDEDDLVDPDDAAPPLDPTWLPHVRLSIFTRGGGLACRVHLTHAADKETAQWLTAIARAWAELGNQLITNQGPALRASSPLDALRALKPMSQQSLERSAGQGSRDRRVLISAPFGLAPLWFFSKAMAPRGVTFAELERLAGFVLRERPERLTEAMVSDVLRRPSIKPDSIRRNHAATLLALAHKADVWRRHRALWPLDTPDELLNDLGVRGGRSAALATLALVGAFD